MTDSEQPTDMDYLTDLMDKMYDVQWLPFLKDVSNRTRLTEVIEEMSDSQRQAFLNMVEEWKYTGRRKHRRKPCLMEVDYAVDDLAFKDFIKDISPDGAFIETHGRFSIGRDITMAFSAPSHDKPVKISGKIVRRVPNGMGIVFKTSDQNLKTTIKSLS